MVYPKLNINESVCRENIRRMTEKARLKKLQFRPHFKTHQSAGIGEWFREEGVDKITVSSVQMAAYFARYGWRDILIAFPLYLQQLLRINELASYCHITVLLSDIASVPLLAQLNNNISLKIELDTSLNRSGIACDDWGTIQFLMQQIQKAHLSFSGFYTHPGHTYSARSKEDVFAIYEQVSGQLSVLKGHFSDEESCFISCGDTPGASVVEDFGCINEITPGNFVYYDLMQHQIGACRISDIAVSVECPVVAKKESTKEVYIHGGAVHFSKEHLTEGNAVVFGKIIKQIGDEYIVSDVCLSRLSQEHGVVTSRNQEWFNSVKVGDVLNVLPVHSCLTANLFKGADVV